MGWPGSSISPLGAGGRRFITLVLARQPQPAHDLALQYEPVAVMLSFRDRGFLADAISRRNAVGESKTDPGPEQPCGVRRRWLVAQGTEAGKAATVTFTLTAGAKSSTWSPRGN